MESDDPKPKSAADAALARAEQHQRMLKEVAEIGLRMCEKLRAQAEAGTTDIAVAARDFDRLSREVCRTLALRQKIRQDADRIAARIAADRAAGHRVAGHAEAAPTSLSNPRPAQSAARARLERDFLADATVPPPEKRGLLH
jgi:hypothetical protein